MQYNDKTYYSRPSNGLFNPITLLGMRTENREARTKTNFRGKLTTKNIARRLTNKTNVFFFKKIFKHNDVYNNSFIIKSTNFFCELIFLSPIESYKTFFKKKIILHITTTFLTFLYQGQTPYFSELLLSLTLAFL